MTNPSNKLLELRDLRVAYGGIQAVKGLNLELREGELVSLIGANGAGKSTTLKAICGLLQPQGGEVRYQGRAIGAQGPWDLVAQGLVMVPEGRGIFARMSIEENLRMGAYLCRDGEVDADIDAVYQRFPRLKERHRQLAGTLSGGEQQMLAMGRALLARPKLLLLDEPTTGLDPQARHLMWERLQQLLQQGKSILLTTHFMDEAERLCDRLLVIDHGRKIAEGTPRELIAAHLEPDVVEVYGGDAQALSTGPLRALASRVEVSGETAFFYTRDAAPLMQALAHEHTLRSLHRPANLEDLFLKLTGRQIREDA